MNNTSPWQKSIWAALIWFIGCSLSGFIFAAVSGEHGSIIFVMFGVAIGACGGLSNSLLLLWAHFRGLPAIQRNGAVWGVAMVLFLGVGVVLSWPTRDLQLMAMYIAVPTLLASIVVDLVLSRKNAA